MTICLAVSSLPAWLKVKYSQLGGEPVRGDAQTRTSDWNLYEAEIHLYCIKPLRCQGLFVTKVSSNLV